MAPLIKAIQVSQTSDAAIYSGEVDPDWTIGSVPNGGYALSLVVEACIQHQKSTKHKDPIHVTAHFLNATALASFKVHIRILKTGRGFTNLLADLIQSDRTRITTHIIFGTLSSPEGSTEPSLNLLPPSPYARRIPLHAHPIKPDTTGFRSAWRFSKYVLSERDSVYREQAKPTSPTRTNSESVGGLAVQWGAWFELTDKSEKLTTSSLCFLADVFQNLPSQLPDAKANESWFPTVTMAIEFKCPIPEASEYYASRTVGIYSSARFMNDPQGRHDQYGEVWTAPCNISENKPEQSGWRDKQRCLAVTTQMALVLPMAVNSRNKSRL